LNEVRLLEIPRRSRFDVIAPLQAIIRVIKAQQIDVVCGHLNLGATFALIAAKLSGRPCIADAIRDCAPDRSPILWLCRRLQAYGADFLVANSRAGFAVRFNGMRPNFTVIPNVVDPARFVASAAELADLRRELHLERFSQVVGMVASMTDYKDHDAFIDAAQLLAGQFSEAGFVLVGNGPRRTALEQRIREVGLTDRFVCTGTRPDADRITQLLDVACLFTNYRIINEGLPNAILEAMMCGKPVVATRGGGTPEVVEEGVNGFLIDQNRVDMIVASVGRLLTDRDLAARYGAAGRASLLQRCSPEAKRSAYLRMLDSLAEQHPGASAAQWTGGAA
jgi:glycosyltransferase involved in cell wall biosynthesis